ncbi:MAG TPA: cation-transporting P-type ATPase [Burkholderiales bacterium]|nr:cation-transporting P-type ATPase [Burkholderiales bacterium]
MSSRSITVGERPPQQDWHALSAEEALRRLDTRAEGLPIEEARARLARFGPNSLPPARTRGALMRFVAQFHNVLIYALLAAALVTAVLGHWLDAGVITGVVLVNALIGFIQEGRAEQAIASIRRMLSLRASVLRGGQRVTLAAEELVPGDVVLLESGDKVPADLRLFAARGLRTEEAALTGESQPVDKTVDPVAADAALGDRLCMAFSGTLVASGRGRGVVVATGQHTELGRITRLLEQVEETTTPLIRKIDAFARRLTIVILGVGIVLFGFGVAARGFRVDEMFMVVAGLAVSAIPEGLPAILTITLAIGVQNMARRKAIVRRLPAVETLGSVTVICSDKTGTLTRDEMTVARVVLAHTALEVDGVGYAPHGRFVAAGGVVDPRQDIGLQALAHASLLCNDARVLESGGAWVAQGDPTEAALVTLALKAGIHDGALSRAHPRLDAVPFESEQRYMATLNADEGGAPWILVKGAPERVLGFCSRQLGPHGEAPLDEAYWQRETEATARLGQRVLALARRRARPGQNALAPEEAQRDLTLLGLVGMIDPPREEAVQAVATCRSAGIRVKMITGDHAATAYAVGRRLGLAGDGPAISGPELEALGEDQLRDVVRMSDVFARVSPEHKLRLVQALQAEGEIAAMTGDGVNDAPALKKADVGVAMGIKGTEAAKEASDMVVADDNFASIAAAVEEGRTVYDNIKKAVLYILPTNGGEVSAIVVAVLAGLAMPITALQILWINMVTETTLSITLAFEKAESRVMQRPPRDPREPLLSGYLVWRIVLVSALLFAGTMGMFLWESARGSAIETARAAAVNALVAGEIAYLFSARFLQASSLNWDGLTGNRWVLVASAVLIALQLGFTYAAPMQTLFGTASLDARAWGLIAAFAVAVFFVVELEKAIWRRVRPDGGPRRAQALAPGRRSA